VTVSDPVADMLTRIRNAVMVRHDSVVVPASRMKLAIARILKEEGYIKDYEVLKVKTHRAMRIHLRYGEKNEPLITGLERVSKPGLRVYVGSKEIPRILGGLGMAIVSTSKGVKTGNQAWHQGVGGELLCYVW